MYSLRSKRMCVGILLGPEDLETLSDEMIDLISFSSHSLKTKLSIRRFARKSLYDLEPSYFLFLSILSAIEVK